MSMKMNRTNARRRVNATTSPPSSSLASTTVKSNTINSPSKNSNKDGRRRKAHEPKLNGQIMDRYVKRKGRALSKVKQICGKFGQMRVVDVALCMGLAFKFGSMLYAWRMSTIPSGVHQVITSEEGDISSLESDYSHTHTKDEEATKSKSNDWIYPKWVQRWMEHKMPFNSPLLYRREDDDYSFGYDSYLDIDDDDDIPTTYISKKPRKTIRFRGMFPRTRDEDPYEELMREHGYVIVDDVLYSADDARERTNWALDHSSFELNPTDIIFDEEQYTYIPAIDFINDAEELPHHHFIDDALLYDNYYAYDDDRIRGTIGLNLQGDDDYTREHNVMSKEDHDDSNVCHRPTFSRLYKPTCNEFHSLFSGYEWLIDHDIHSRRWKRRKQFASNKKSRLSKFLGHGYYRDAFLYTGASASDEAVFKTMRHMYRAEEEGVTITDDDDLYRRGLGYDPGDKYTPSNYKEDMRKDAMVMELLSSSPYAINLYAHCSMSSITEFAPVDIADYIMPTGGYSPKRIIRRGAKKNELDDEPLNDHISPEEKLEIALQMAKGLAAMHGYKDGIIAHVDVQVGQFFKGKDGLVKIVDYNRAEVLLYDTKKDRYCKWRNDMPPDGSARAPEENRNHVLTEAIDVYSLGNVFYSLLTGRLVFEASPDYDTTHYRIANGITQEIPNFYRESSPSSKLLVDAIELCWTWSAEDRPSIFYMVDFLTQAVEAVSH